jgi:DNA-binding GntR family transcriptional regulator
MTLSWPKQQKLPLARRVADEIRTAILESRLVPGDRLIEGQLAREMDVSRASVRDALRQLETEGLVSITPWHGTRVVGLSELDVSEVASLRARLEAFAIELATARISASSQQQLENCVDRMRTEAERGNLHAINEADYDFHATIWRMAGHRRLLQALETISPTVWALITISNQVDSPIEGIEEHRHILEAMIRRKSTVAQRLAPIRK